MPLEQVIGANLGALFPGMEIVGWYAFRVTRYSDLELAHSDEAEDLLGDDRGAGVPAPLRRGRARRSAGRTCRRTCARCSSRSCARTSRPRCRRSPSATSSRPGRCSTSATSCALATLDMPELRDPPFTPVIPPELRDTTRSIFDVIRERDILVHHPFDSFPAIGRALPRRAARDDPNVLAIKLTLYRTSGDTAIVRALTEAAQRGKQVAVIVELKARFDEANNITWARTLEGFGVHVAYGSPGSRRTRRRRSSSGARPDGIRRYVAHRHRATTTRRRRALYTDVGLLTCSPSIGADVSDLFNSLTGFSRQQLYRKLLVAPANMRERFTRADRARGGRTRAAGRRRGSSRR